MTSWKPKTEDVPQRYSQGWLDRMDGRRALVQHMRSRVEGIADDLGGRDGLSVMQLSLIERFVFLEYWIHEAERTAIEGGEFSPGAWIQAYNSLQGAAKTLGIERKARQVPSLQEYLQAKREEKRGNGEART